MVREDVRGFVGSQCTFFSEDQQQEQQKNWQIYKKIPKTKTKKQKKRICRRQMQRKFKKCQRWKHGHRTERKGFLLFFQGNRQLSWFHVRTGEDIYRKVLGEMLENTKNQLEEFVKWTFTEEEEEEEELRTQVSGWQQVKHGADSGHWLNNICVVFVLKCQLNWMLSCCQLLQPRPGKPKLHRVLCSNKHGLQQRQTRPRTTSHMLSLHSMNQFNCRLSQLITEQSRSVTMYCS